MRLWVDWAKNGVKSNSEFVTAFFEILSAIRNEETIEEKLERTNHALREARREWNELNNLSDLIRDEIVQLFDTGGGEVRRPVDFTSVLRNWIFYSDKAQNYDENTTNLMPKVNIVLTIITNIGMIVSVLMSAFMGIKYMLGSIEEKAELKKDLIPYLVGAILLFGISAMVNVMLEIGKSINNS